MPAPPSTKTMLATAGRILHRLLVRHGLDADALFIECGLDPLKLNDPRARYPLERYRALWQLVSERIKDPCWGLAAGEVFRPTDYHALGCAFLASRTLEAALLRLERYYRLVNQDVSLRVDSNPDSLRISYAPPSPDADIPPLQDTRWATIFRLCRDAYGPELRPLEVQLTHPWLACSYELFFGCPVRYEADRSGLTFALAVAHEPLPAANRELAKANDSILDKFARTLTDGSITGRVRRVIADKLTSGRPNARTVARELALAPRTLQRKLQEEGTTFQDVSEAVRRDLAIQYVQSGDYNLSQVTYLTGFTNTSAFARAYKAWTGRTPREDRGTG